MENGTDYKPTQAELDAFIKDRNGYINPIFVKATTKPTHGQLVYINGNYKEVIKNAYNKPFALLQSIKRQMIKQGYKKEFLFIKNL